MLVLSYFWSWCKNIQNRCSPTSVHNVVSNQYITWISCLDIIGTCNVVVFLFLYICTYTVNLLCSLSFDEIMDGLLLSKTCQYGEDVQITFTQQKDKTVYFKEIATVAFCVCIYKTSWIMYISCYAKHQRITTLQIPPVSIHL